MEDAHTTILNLNDPNQLRIASTQSHDQPTEPNFSSNNSGSQNHDKTSFFAVFDGHGGSSVARYCGKNLHNRIVSDESFKTNINVCLKNSFLGTDVDLKSGIF